MSQSISRRGLLTAALAAVPAHRLLADSTLAEKPEIQNPIRLIANENPYGPSKSAQAAATKAVSNGWKYAMKEITALKKQLADLHGVSPEHIIVTAGSGESLKIAALALCQGGGRVVAAKPTFTLITSYAESLGCEVDWVPLDSDMVHDLDAMAAAISYQTRLVYVCNPNNPTGTRVDGRKLHDFLATVSQKVPVVVDEAYLDLNEDEAEQTAIPRVLAGDPVIVTRTFSKLHGMAGMRVGYAIAQPEMITRFNALRMSFMNYPGVMAASASLQDTDFLEFSRSKIQQCMAVTVAALEELGLAYTPSSGNFILFDTGGSAEEFKTAMLEKGILTGKPEPEYPGWVRISMGKFEQMEQFAEAAPKTALYRPESDYVGNYCGPDECAFVPMEKR